MICSNCKQAIPDDSEFCPYCGKEMPKSIATLSCPFCGKKVPDDSEFCQFCGADIKSFAATASVPSNEKIEKQDKGKLNFKVFSIILLVISVILASANIYQYTLYSKCINEISSLNSTITIKENVIDKLEEKADLYDFLCTTGSFGNVGYAAYNFNCSSGVVFVNENSEYAKVTLTAYWSYGGTVSVGNSDPSVARIDFDKDSWNQSTSMTITPYNAGISVVTFTNSVDSNTFKLIIVVTD